VWEWTWLANWVGRFRLPTKSQPHKLVLRYIINMPADGLSRPLAINSCESCKIIRLEVSIDWLTNRKRTTNLAMSPSMRPSEICNGPSNSWDGITYVVRAKLNTLATAKKISDNIWGSFGCQSMRAVTAIHHHSTAHNAYFYWRSCNDDESGKQHVYSRHWKEA